MCLLALLAFAVFMLITIFVKSAIVLLPWTVTASALGGLSGLALGKAGIQRFESAAQGVCFAVSFVMTYLLGYLGWWLIPPTEPSQPNRSNWWEVLMTFPEPKRQDLWNMFPVHLGIAGVVAALIAVSLVRRAMQAKPETIVIKN